MNLPLVLLRPQPGNDATAIGARTLGLDVIQLPLFTVAPVEPGRAPEGPFDALLLTSANGARYGKNIIAAFGHIPAYAVGTATARAAIDAGHGLVRPGGGDAASTAAIMAEQGHDRVLHLCGEDVRPFDPLDLNVTRHIVYRVVERDDEMLRTALEKLPPAVIAIHSPRGGRRLAALVPPERRPDFHIAAISAAAADACGAGWADLSISGTPDDTALLACAEALCIRAG